MKTAGKILKWIFVSAALFLALGIGAIALVYSMFYTSRDEFFSDAGVYAQAFRVDLFNRGYIKELSSDDVRYVYQKRCYRQCHGESAMITAILSPSGWIQVVERMRMKERVEITGREADVIIKYLEDKYPTTKSGYPYETRKKIHQAVWRNDMGQGDIYCDVIYVTPEYLKSIGAEHLIDEYEVKAYDVFIVSFTVHEGEVDTVDLDKISRLYTPAGSIPTAPPWRLRFQTADKHHYEADIRFRKSSGAPAPWMELRLSGVGGPKDRAYRWDLPIPYPQDVAAEAIK